MMVIPFSDAPGTYKVFIVLEDDNIERLKAYDPAQLSFPLPGFEDRKLLLVFVGYATLADRDIIVRLSREGKINQVLQHLSHGFAFRPEVGDYDGPPMSLLKKDERSKQ